MLSLLFVTSLAAAQDKPDPAKLAEQSLRAFEKGDLAEAERLLRQQLVIDDKNFVPHYNLACLLAMRGESEPAMDALVNAVQRGFVDWRQLNRDPSLNPLRGSSRFEAMLTNWPTVLERHRDAAWELAKTNFKHSDTAVDEKTRLTFVSAFDRRAFESARREIGRVADWGASVFPNILDADAARNDPWVVVVLPNRTDYLAWLIANFGKDAVTSVSSIGGSYDHDAKRLVAQDLGSSLRHEFFHVLHWRDMARRGQLHPIWVQEGLCSLVEDYDLVDGVLKPATSWRTNIAKRLEKNGLLMPIEKLCALPRAQFMTGRPLAMYAQARTAFLYLHDKGKLAEWYAAFCEDFGNDPTGVGAWKAVMGTDLPALNKDYRAWVRALPAVPEEIKPGQASLGMEVDSGNGEGPIIISISRHVQIQEGPRALRQGDVITSIDQKSTRDIAELVRVLSQYKPGDAVELTYRRGKTHGTATVTLLAK